MHRWIVRFGMVVIAGLPFVLGACVSKGNAKVSTMARAPSTTAAESDRSPTSTPSSEASGAATATAASSTATQLTSGCPLVCTVANKGRLATADEARLAAGLADVFQALRQCPGGDPSPPLTLRFDSTSALTSLGIDAEERGDGACIDDVRQRKPQVTFPGPAIVRCVERCKL